MRFILGLVFLVLTGSLFAQEKHHGAEAEQRGIFELITSGIYAQAFESDADGALGAEVHLTYWVVHKYGFGFSYTAKVEEELTVHDLALLGSWNATRWLTVNTGPNFVLPNEHRDFSISAYAETELNIRPTEWFHFGPVVGTLLGSDSEYFLGFHLGFEFVQ